MIKQWLRLRDKITGEFVADTTPVKDTTRQTYLEPVAETSGKKK